MLYVVYWILYSVFYIQHPFVLSLQARIYNIHINRAMSVNYLICQSFPETIC